MGQGRVQRQVDCPRAERGCAGSCGTVARAGGSGICVRSTRESVSSNPGHVGSKEEG